MFIGHFAVGLAAKRVAPAASLGVLIAAPLLPDLVWPVLLAAGVERVRIAPGFTAVMPIESIDIGYSHSLLFAGVAAIGFGALYFAIRKDGRAAFAIAVGVLSHWLLDYVTHAPDMTLVHGGSRYGLGLWNSLAGTLAVEGALFGLGVWVYARSTRARDRIGRISFWVFIGFLLVMYAMNLFGPPPPNELALTIASFFAWPLVGWAAWFDRHRSVDPPR